MIFFLSFGAALLGKAGAQPVKLYAYVQKVTPGIAANKDFNEDGTTKPVKTEPLVNYFLYLTVPAKSKIEPLEAWIKGKRVGLKTEMVSTPVRLEKAAGGSDSILPKKSERIMRLTGTEASAKTLSAKGASLAKDAEAVVVYKQNGKLYIVSQKKLVDVKGEHLQ